MFKHFLLGLALCISGELQAQYLFTAVIKDSKTQEPLSGVVVRFKNSKTAVASDQNGSIRLTNIPAGQQILYCRFIGYETLEQAYTFPMSDTTTQIILLQAEEEELEEVVISSTRTSRGINDVPTRVELVELEEIEEKANMRPSNVSMLLHESTGIQVQQTSATSGNASIRIQGLDGRYTQLLKDGFANYGNFSSGLSVLEIPPLDLQQVEVIKGPASTLYGGGAIAGVVNFISKQPQEKAQFSTLINQSHIGQSDVGLFMAQKYKKLGYTLLTQYNYQKAYDVDKDGFSELPLSATMTVHPKVFWYPTDKSSLSIGNSFTRGQNKGGDLQVLQGASDSLHQYVELNQSLRNNTNLEFLQKIGAQDRLTIKSSWSYFERSIDVPSYTFKGRNTTSFTDLNYLHKKERQTFILGGSFVAERFREQTSSSLFLRDFNTSTSGLYLQHTWDISKKFVWENGLRFDHIRYNNHRYSEQESFLLPRSSFLVRFNERFSSRLGGCLGYKAPTLFTEATESILYRNLLPLQGLKSERSYGGTVDLNYKWPIGRDLLLTINQLFFLTRIQQAGILSTDSAGLYSLSNANQPLISKGFESNLKLIFKEYFKFFGGYTYTDAKAGYLTGDQHVRLLPAHKLNLCLLVEKEDNFKIGLEGYYTGMQHLNTGRSPSFWEFGLSAQKTFGKLTVFGNLENIGDVRQSRYKRVVNPPNTAPTFDEIWTHVEGFVMNAGLKFKL